MVKSQDRPTVDAAMTYLSDGRVVLGDQSAMGPHPNPKLTPHLVEFKDLREILVDDGSADGLTLWACVKTTQHGFCGKVWDSLPSAMSHKNQHDMRRHSYYDQRTLRVIAAVIRQVKSEHHRAWAQVAADRLNRQGIQTSHGNEWTNQSVSSLYNAHLKNSRRVVRFDTKSPMSSGGVTSTTVPSPMQQLVTSLDALQRAVRDVMNANAALGPTLARLTNGVDPAELETLRDKARRWDALKASLE